MAAVPPARPARERLRLLTAVPLCDGHDSAITTINLELAAHGAEVIYLGYHQAASAIARAAVQEDVHAVGLSSYNGGHLVFFREVRAQLDARGARDIPIFGGGGGTITPRDARVLQRAGIGRIFFAGTPLDEIAATLEHDCRRALRRDNTHHGDRALARAITLAEFNRTGDGRKTGNRRPETENSRRPESAVRRTRPSQLRSLRSVSGFRSPVSGFARTFTVGFAGPGGAGKSTLIDELTARFVRSRPSSRVAILANDPSRPDSGGAILGDRVSAIYAQDDRVFFRSMATRGSLTGISAAAPAAISLLREAGEFDLVFVESVGIGQESDPFDSFGAGPKLVDALVFVTPPHYGGRIQLQKIALLNAADLVVLNKFDDPRATAAKTELTAQLHHRAAAPPLYPTIASQHADRGVDRLYAALEQLAGLEPAGGEKACQLEVPA